ncbi:MAG: septal ring lytic transglycosylase RlpA family protein, partial [Treponema sp.]|nr:septal ring lytic transglycosylase RlpA family protein [Treponema sp.]
MKLIFKLVASALFFLLAIGMLIGASIWEGAAAVAPDGVLPSTGYYAATNAFPRNTVVIVTNLENGKTVQVVVVAALDNASVLTLLSKEAASAIALSASYPGRVRIMEAIDPVTMLPLIENKISNEDPDYDPMARINSASPNSSAPLSEGEAPVLVEEESAPADAEGVVAEDET